MLKKSACIAVILLILSSAFSANAFGAGILYPKVAFDFSQINEPPVSARKRLEAGERFPQELQFFMDVEGNNFKYDIEVYIFSKKVHTRLLVKDISYVFEGKKGCFLKNAEFILPENVCRIDEKQIFPCWIANGEYYWTADIFMKPVHKSLPKVNFEKIFRGKKAGDSFTFKMSCTYSFDDEEERTLELEYRVRCSKGEWVSPFMGW
ncbi:hypothetical protein [Treponema sp.]|uniref:hypothetical protein n=1 Tax=Treponema sp. TaxID=166 RepID=UPI003F082C28